MNQDPLKSAALELLEASFLSQNEPQTFVVKTDSMSPVIAAGDTVTVFPLRSRPKFGDILVYRTVTDLIVHRYLGTVPFSKQILIKGDLRGEFDAVAKNFQPIGKVIPAQNCGRHIALVSLAHGLITSLYKKARQYFLGNRIFAPGLKIRTATDRFFLKFIYPAKP